MRMSDVVIVGAGHAAGQVVASLKQNKFAGRIRLLGEEAWYPYQRPPLSKKYLAGLLPAERLYVKPPNFYSDDNISVHLDTRVTAIDRAAKCVRCADESVYGYSDLVLATGSRPRALPFEHAGLGGVHYLRGIDDVNAIRADMENARRLLIIGAGYIGLEVAAVAATAGFEVTVVEMTERVMNRVVSPELSDYYQQVHESHGVRIRLNAAVTAFEGGDRVTAVVLDAGERIDADLVIIGIGIVPNSELAEAAQLDVDNGIVVDSFCRTSDAHVYAVGDCTNHPNPVLDTRLRLESVQNALDQARVAAANICGEALEYREVPWFWSDQYDLKLQIAGISAGYDECIIRGAPEENEFACLYLRNGRLLAVDAVNRPRDFMQSKSLIAAGVVADREKLADVDVPLKDLLAGG